MRTLIGWLHSTPQPIAVKAVYGTVSIRTDRLQRYKLVLQGFCGPGVSRDQLQVARVRVVDQELRVRYSKPSTITVTGDIKGSAKG